VQARLLEKSLLPRHQTLLLESGGLIFPASMDAQQPFAKLVPVPVGSVLRVTAICVLQRDKNGLNQSFQLLVNEPGDIAIISQPPWLNLSRALFKSDSSSWASHISDVRPRQMNTSIPIQAADLLAWATNRRYTAEADRTSTCRNLLDMIALAMPRYHAVYSKSELVNHPGFFGWPG